MTTTKPTTIDEYISGFPEDIQKRLQQIRTAIKKTVPAAEEAISYSIPTFNLNGKYLIYFAAYKKHIGMYPAPGNNKEFEEDFEPYHTSGRGTIQFPHDKLLPINLITKIVKFREKERREKTIAKKTATKSKNSSKA